MFASCTEMLSQHESHLGLAGVHRGLSPYRKQRLPLLKPQDLLPTSS